MTISKSRDRVTGLDAEHLGLDEIVASGCWFHFERMSNTHVWFAVHTQDGKRISVHLHAGGRKITANVEQESVKV